MVRGPAVFKILYINMNERDVEKYRERLDKE